jgi:hypothetical protein
MNAGVNPDELVPIVNLSSVKPLSISGKGARAFVNKWKGAPLKISTDANGEWKMSLSSHDSNHPFWSSYVLGRHDATRRDGISKDQRRSEAAKKYDAADREADRLFKTYQALQEEYITALGNAPRGAKEVIELEYKGKMDVTLKEYGAVKKEAQTAYSGLVSEI